MQKKISRGRRNRLLIYGGILLFFLLLPYEFAENGPFVCPSARVGFPCPGCGVTRALTLLMKGQFSAAYALNESFTAVIFPLLLLLMGQDVFVILTHRPLSVTEYLWRGGRK